MGYTCVECNTPFDNIRTLRSHTSSIRHICGVCRMSFCTYEGLHNHQVQEGHIARYPDIGAPGGMTHNNSNAPTSFGKHKDIFQSKAPFDAVPKNSDVGSQTFSGAATHFKPHKFNPQAPEFKPANFSSTIPTTAHGDTVQSGDVQNTSPSSKKLDFDVDRYFGTKLDRFSMCTADCDWCGRCADIL